MKKMVAALLTFAADHPAQPRCFQPGVGVGFLVSMVLVGAAVAVIVPIAIGYAAGHGEGEYAGHVRNGAPRQRPPHDTAALALTPPWAQ